MPNTNSFMRHLKFGSSSSVICTAHTIAFDMWTFIGRGFAAFSVRLHNPLCSDTQSMAVSGTQSLAGKDEGFPCATSFWSDIVSSPRRKVWLPNIASGDTVCQALHQSVTKTNRHSSLIPYSPSGVICWATFKAPCFKSVVKVHAMHNVALLVFQIWTIMQLP